jgi:hypothetical protein
MRARRGDIVDRAIKSVNARFINHKIDGRKICVLFRHNFVLLKAILMRASARKSVNIGQLDFFGLNW